MADIESNIKVNIDTSDALAQLKLLQQQISAFQQGMKNAGAQNASAAAAMQQNLMSSINATGKFSANIQTIKTSAESFTESLERNKLSIGQYFKYAGGASKTFGKLFKTEFDTIEQVAVDRVKTIQTQYIKLGRDASGAMKAIAVRPLALDMNNLGTKTQIAAQKQQLFNQLMKQGSTQLLNFGKNTQWAGRQLMVGFTIPLTLMGQAAAQAYMKIEAASIKFKRVYGDMQTTTEEANKMVKSVQALANEFTKYGVAVAETMEMAASAAAMGKTGTDLMAQVAQASKLAVLGQVDQQQALETTISLTNAFGVSTEELAKNIDFLNAVENQTVVSIEDLTIAIPKAAPVVQQLGGDVEDLTFFLTAMKEGGINASEGANALKSGLASMINPTKKASDFLAKFGVNIQSIVEGNKGDIRGTVVDFAKALDTLDPLNRARAIEQMFGKFQFSRLSTLFKNVIDEGSQASKVAGLANQTAEELAILSEREMNKISDSPMFKFQKSIQDMQAKLAPVGEAFLKAVTPIIEFVTKILDGFNNLSEGTKSFVSMLVLAVAGIGPVLLMTFGLIANGVANIMKLFTNMKSFINKTTKPSDILGEQTGYMNTEQLKSAAIAASLDQSHAKLRQTFTSEAAAVKELTRAYQNAVQAQQAYSGVPGIQVGTPQTPNKYANGVSMVPGPSGAGDIVPALLSPGEAVIPARSARKYAPVIRGMIAGNLPGFNEGTSGVGMRQSLIGPLNQKQTEGIVKTGKTLKDISDEVVAGPYGQVPVTNYGTQVSPSPGHSFPAFGVAGIYEKPDGTKVFVKPQMDLVSAMAEIRGTTIARDAHGLVAPQQSLRVMMDPTDPENMRKFLVLESALDERIANIPTSFSKDDYFKQLVASLLRGDKDLGVGNLGGNILADVGPAGVFQRASGKRALGSKINSMEEQAIINLLGVKGGAKRFFAESTSEIAKSMTPAEYDAAMKAEIQAVAPKLQATIAGFGNLSPEEKKAYMDMQQRLQAGMGVDWAKYQVMHSGVPPKKYSMGTPSVSANDYQSKSQEDREDLYRKNITKLDDKDINDYFGLQDTHIVGAISDPNQRNEDGTRKSLPSQAQIQQMSEALGGEVSPEKLASSGYEVLSNATARMISKVNQRMKKDNKKKRLDGTQFSRVWDMFGNKFNKLALVSSPGSRVSTAELESMMSLFDKELIKKIKPLGEVTDETMSTAVHDILREQSGFEPIAESVNRVGALRSPVPEGTSANEAAYAAIASGATVKENTATVIQDIYANEEASESGKSTRLFMNAPTMFEVGDKWWNANPTVSTSTDLDQITAPEREKFNSYLRHVMGKRARVELWNTENKERVNNIRNNRNPRLQRPSVTTKYSSPDIDQYQEIRDLIRQHPGYFGKTQDNEAWFENNILPVLQRGTKTKEDFQFKAVGLESGMLSIAKTADSPARPAYDSGIKLFKNVGNLSKIIPGADAVKDFEFLKELELFKTPSSNQVADKFFEGVARYAKGGIVPGGTGKPKASVFDIDDTLLDLSGWMQTFKAENDKLPEGQKKKWYKEVAKDPKGIPGGLAALKAAQLRGNKILLMTARPELNDAYTLETLQKLGIDMNGVKLISRKDKDYRKPEQMKYEKTSKYSQWYDIEEFYDDMPKTRGAVGLMGINAIDPLKLAMGSVKIPGYADGVFSVPGPKGAGDIVPAMLSPGEAVIPAKQSAKYQPLIKEMIYGKIPGYEQSNIPNTGGGGLFGNIPFGAPVKVVIVGDETAPGLPAIQQEAAEKQIDAAEFSKLTDEQQRDEIRKQQSAEKDQQRKQFSQQSKIESGYDEMSPKEQKKFDEKLQKKFDKEDKKPSRVGKLFQRTAFTGKAQGIAYGASTVAGLASTIPGGVGQAAQAALPAIGAATSAMSMIPGPAGLVVGALAAIATVGIQLNSALAESRKKAVEFTEAMGTGNKALMKFEKFAKTVSSSEIMDRKREGMFSPYEIKPGKQTFGSSYMETEDGKALVKTISEAQSKGGSAEAQQLLTQQLAAAIASGVLKADQARSVAGNVGARMGNQNLGIGSASTLLNVFGPNGENLAKEPLKIRLEVTKASQQQLAKSIDILQQTSISSAKTGVKTISKQWQTQFVGPLTDLSKGNIFAGISNFNSITMSVKGYTNAFNSIEQANTSAAAFAAQSTAALETQKQMLDGLDLEYEKRIQIAKAQGNAQLAADLAAKKEEDKARLLEENKKTVDAIVVASNNADKGFLASFGVGWWGQQDAIKETANTAIQKKFEGTGQEVQAKMATQDIDAMQGNFGQQTLLKQEVAAGQIGLSQVGTIKALYGDTQEGMDTLVNMIGEKGIQVDQALQVAQMFNNVEDQKRFMLTFSAEADAAKSQELIDAMALISKNRSNINVNFMMTYFQNNQDVALKIKQDMDKISALKGKALEIKIIAKYLGKDELALLKIDTEYFNRLDKSQQIVYTTSIKTTTALKGTKEFKAAAATYKAENKGATDEDYQTAVARSVTAANVDATVDPNAQEENKVPETPQASFLDQYVNSIRDASGWQQKLTIGFADSMKAMKRWSKDALASGAGLAQRLNAYGADANFIQAVLGGDQKDIDKIIDRATGKLTKAGRDAIKIAKQVEDAKIGMAYVTSTESERAGKDNELYSAGLDVISNKEKKVNDKYDKRIKALDEIGKIQEKNNQKQQSTLDLADALSKGDISAAARIAMKAKQESQKAALDDAKTSLENARKEELENITVNILGSTETRQSLEEKIEKNTAKIAANKLKELDRQVGIGKNAVIAAEAAQKTLEAGKKLSVLPKPYNPVYGGDGTSSSTSTTEITPPTDVLPIIGADDAWADKKEENKDLWANLFPDIGTWLATQWTALQTWVADITNPENIGEFMGNMWNGMKGIETWLAEQVLKIQEWFFSIPEQIGTAAKDFWNGLPDLQIWLQQRGDELTQWVIDTPSRTWNQLVVSPGDAAANWFGDLFSGFSKTQDEDKDADTKYPSSGGSIYKAGGGVIPQYFNYGGFTKRGTDTIPAMLTPGEFVMKKSSVDSIGVQELSRMNSLGKDGMSEGESVYNYSITLNVNSSSDSNDIADAVLRQIKRIDSQRIRSSNI